MKLYALTTMNNWDLNITFMNLLFRLSTIITPATNNKGRHSRVFLAGNGAL
jgi:hypothetical protein